MYSNFNIDLKSEQFKELIGSGTFSAVYKVTDSVSKKSYAVKKVNSIDSNEQHHNF